VRSRSIEHTSLSRVFADCLVYDTKSNRCNVRVRACRHRSDGEPTVVGKILQYRIVRFLVAWKLLSVVLRRYKPEIRGFLSMILDFF